MKEKIINISATLAGISLIALILRPVQPQAKINQQSAVLSECYNSHVDYKVETGEISVDEYELSLMAHLLMGECGATCNDDEMLYLAGAVVLNRVQSEYFPNSIASTVGKSRCAVERSIRAAIKSANHDLSAWKNYDCLTARGVITTMYYRCKENANE